MPGLDLAGHNAPCRTVGGDYYDYIDYENGKVAVALADVAGLNAPPTAGDLGFTLGPRINAGGRIGDSALGAKLLSTSDEQEAARIATLLDRLNRERKAIETQMLEEALAADSLSEVFILDDNYSYLATTSAGTARRLCSRSRTCRRGPAKSIGFARRTPSSSGRLRRNNTLRWRCGSAPAAISVNSGSTICHWVGLVS